MIWPLSCWNSESHRSYLRSYLEESSLSTIDAIIFDIGGVLVKHDNALLFQRLAKHCQSPQASALAIRDAVMNSGLRTGEQSVPDFYTALVCNFGFEGDYERFVELWVRGIDPIPDMLALVHQLRGAYRLFILSDTNEEHWQHIAKSYLDPALFEDVFLSHRLGMVKPDPRLFAHVVQTIGCPPAHTVFTTYLQHREPWQQSGFSGPQERWAACRRPIADCVEDLGAFLDIGCANGYLLECILHWTQERNLSIAPFGLDLSPRLVELAKERLPNYRENLFVGNPWDWQSPITFDYIRTELVYVPDALQRQYIGNIFRRILSSRGKLLVTEYLSTKDPLSRPTVGDRLEAWGHKIRKQVSGYWEGKEMTRVMVLESIP